MSAPTQARALAPKHIHLPSVHVRSGDGRHGYDYEEDLYRRGHGRRRRVERIIRLAIVENDRPILIRETFDVLCADELANLMESLPALLETDIQGESSPEIAEHMQLRAQLEFERQIRIAAGTESACARCGCSETRSCSGGCLWLTSTLCSRCA